MTWLRWQLSVLAWWAWIKVTPDGKFKRDMIDAVVTLRAIYPEGE